MGFLYSVVRPIMTRVGFASAAAIVVIPIGLWLLLPLEPTIQAGIISGAVVEHRDATGNRASPRPYYIIELPDGLRVKAQDYKVLSAKVGSALTLEIRKGVVTGRSTYIIRSKP